MKYIDAEKLKDEIERRIEETKSMKPSFDRFWAGQISAFKGVRTIIESLQQEQPQKSQKDCNNCPHCVDRKDQFGWHFKGCFGGSYKGKFIAEIKECPLKQEQPEADGDDGKFVKILVRKELAE